MGKVRTAISDLDELIEGGYVEGARTFYEPGVFVVMEETLSWIIRDIWRFETSRKNISDMFEQIQVEVEAIKAKRISLLIPLLHLNYLLTQQKSGIRYRNS